MTNNTPSILALFVIYAKDIRKVAGFYQQTLQRPVVEEAQNFIIVGDSNLEIAIIRMNTHIAANTNIATPPRIRDETPVKCSFLVEDLQRVKDNAEATGGATKSLASAWLWRGQLHLDGHDPEGNVVQFRMPANGQSDPL